MKTKFPFSCLLLVVVGVTVHAFAAISEVSEAALAFPDSFPAEAREKVNAALRRPDCTFVGGTSFMTGTVLRYEGETVPLNLFMKGLAACPGITLSFRFNTPENANYDWALEQDGLQPDRLCVRVNLKSARLKMENLVIPDRMGPALPAGK